MPAPPHAPHSVAENEAGLADAVIDGITTRYEVIGSGPALLMFSPGGFDATLDKWTTLGMYARIKALDHIPALIVPGRDASHATSGGEAPRGMSA